MHVSKVVSSLDETLYTLAVSTARLTYHAHLIRFDLMTLLSGGKHKLLIC